MLKLHELQTAWQAMLFSDDMILLRNSIIENGLSVQQRFQIYQHNYFSTLIDALQSVYAITYQLVGEDFFVYMAKDYILHNPSLSGDIRQFGKDFATFIATFPAVQYLPYLADMARLEWAYHEVFHAADVECFNLAELQSMDKNTYPQLKFLLNPACRLIESEYPILEIWQLHQGDNDKIIELSSSHDKVLILRVGLEVTLTRLNAAEFVLLQAFAEGLCFAEACKQAASAEPTIMITPVMQKFVSTNVIVSFSL